LENGSREKIKENERKETSLGRIKKNDGKKAITLEGRKRK
jgi:hypothetical protein